MARLGGLAAGLGGLLSALVNARNLIPFFFEGRRPLAELGLGPFVSLLSFFSIFICTLFFAAALTCLYALLGRRSALGISGLVLAYLSVLASALPGGPVRGFLLGVGVVLLGAAIFRARVLGRWRALLSILGLLIFVVSLLYGPALRPLLPPLTPALGASLGLPLGLPTVFPGLCWILLGAVMWSYASREEARVTQGEPASHLS